MFLTNLSKREQALIFFAVGIIFFSLLYNFTLQPLRRKWGQLNSQIINKEIELKRNVRYLKQKDKVQEIYLQYAEYIKKQGSDEEEMASFLNEVEKQARLAEIQIANIRPKPIKETGFYRKYILEMNCQATMEKYIEFIYNLQTSAQLIRAEELKLNSQGKNNPLLRARLLINKVLTSD